MDRNGDGVDAEELLHFIKEQHAELSSRKADNFLRLKCSCYGCKTCSLCCGTLRPEKVFSFIDGNPEDAVKKEPWKQRNPFEKACASGEGPSLLAWHVSDFCGPPGVRSSQCLDVPKGCVFVNLGRIKPPHMRLAMSGR